MRRRTFWLTWLSLFITNTLLVLLLFGMGAIGGENSIGLVVLLAVLFWVYNVLLAISMQVRRLHDINKSGAFVLLHLVPFGSLVLLIFFLSDSAPGTNQYGPNPKGVAAIKE